MLSLLFKGNLGYGDNGDQRTSLLFNSSLSVLRTNKTHVTMGYILHVIKDDTMNSFNCNWGWNLSRYLTLSSSANYQIREEGDSWNINARLNASF